MGSYWFESRRSTMEKAFFIQTCLCSTVLTERRGYISIVGVQRQTCHLVLIAARSGFC